MGKHSKKSRFYPQGGAGTLWRPALCTTLVTSGVVLVSSSVFTTGSIPKIGPDSGDPLGNDASDAQTVLLPRIPDASTVEAPTEVVRPDTPELTGPRNAAQAAADAARNWRPPVRTTTPKPSTTKSVPTASPAKPPTQSVPLPPRATGKPCGQTGWGLKPRAAQLANHIKSKFPLISAIGGYRASARDPSGHPSGLAIDFSVPIGGILGDSIARYLLDNKSTLHVQYVIWKQRYNDGSGWRAMENRGSITENHMDHVHVNVIPGPADISNC